MKKMPQEFFLVIPPSQQTQRYFELLKKRVRKAIGHGFQGEHSKAHISLFKYYDHHTESELYTFEDKVSQFKSFEIGVKDLGVFKHGANGTIYFEIVYPGPIAELTDALFGKDITPHITIARNLAPDDFKLAWEALRETSYSDFFICDEIKVLKKVSTGWKDHVRLALR